MTDDTWWAFIATIDRRTLLLELPGSVLDRRMREQHAVKVAAFYSRDSDAHDPAPVIQRKQPTPLDKQLAAYAANKRKKAA